LKKLHWTDAKGRKRVWETAERTTRTKSGNGADAVTMFVKLIKKGETTKTLVISQFRPPLNAWSIEFPAGLIDEGETPEEAAKRELEEETGFVASDVTLSYPLANDPGMSNTSQILCVTTVDLDDPRNHNAKPRLDDEFIVTHFVELPSLLETIEGTFSS
jgi:ADP-ribose pyrophosphatase